MKPALIIMVLFVHSAYACYSISNIVASNTTAFAIQNIQVFLKVDKSSLQTFCSVDRTQANQAQQTAVKIPLNNLPCFYDMTLSMAVTPIGTSQSLSASINFNCNSSDSNMSGNHVFNFNLDNSEYYANATDVILTSKSASSIRGLTMLLKPSLSELASQFSLQIQFQKETCADPKFQPTQTTNSSTTCQVQTMSYDYSLWKQCEVTGLFIDNKNCSYLYQADKSYPFDTLGYQSYSYYSISSGSQVQDDGYSKAAGIVLICLVVLFGLAFFITLCCFCEHRQDYLKTKAELARLKAQNSMAENINKQKKREAGHSGAEADILDIKIGCDDEQTQQPNKLKDTIGINVIAQDDEDEDEKDEEEDSDEDQEAVDDQDNSDDVDEQCDNDFENSIQSQVNVHSTKDDQTETLKDQRF